MRAYFLLLLCILGASCGGAKANTSDPPCVGFYGFIFLGCTLEMVVAADHSRLHPYFVSAMHSAKVEFTEEHRRPARAEDCSELSEAIEDLMWAMVGSDNRCELIDSGYQRQSGR